MSRPHAPKLALCAIAIAALAVPTVAAAGDPGTGGSQAPPPPQTEGVITASSPQIAMSTRAGTMVRKLARFRGTAPGAAGQTVAVERFDATTDQWSTIATTKVAADGSYIARWRPTKAGQLQVRAVVRSASFATAANASPELAITIHRPAMATWYGPGFYGRMTACGVRMTRTLLGVAHKKLKCGTKVAVLYKGRRIDVPVVDRGPFRHGTKYDLTAATAQALGFDHTDRLGAIRLRTAP